MTPRYQVEPLLALATALLERAGLEKEKASVVAAVLVEGDLLGHNTHGLQLLSAYLGELESGAMAKTGQPRIIADYPAAVTWDGQRLPGAWLTVKAIELAMARCRQMGTCTVVIRRSHHIACLAAYLQKVAAEGLTITLMCSDPNTAGVAPHGGRRDVFTPNPIAAAWPTSGDPVMLDVSTSITTHGMTRRLFTEGKHLPGNWLIDAEGGPSDDPAIMFGNPPGALLPMGGLDHGHKGYAFGLWVEALTGGLAGHGRADPREGWMGTVFLQIADPELFGGRDDFLRQTTWVADTCRETPPRPGVERVRLPGEAGLRRREDQLKRGLELYPSILPALKPWADKFGCPLPQPSA